MIINVRGTSGSGKSSLVRRIMALYPTKEPIHVQGRKQPLGYLLDRGIPGMRKLYVPGHYETPCGGCDTISDGMDRIYGLIRMANMAGHNVLYEGLLVSAEVNRAQALKDEGLPLLVVHLDIPLEICLAGINQRRRAKKPDAEDVNPKNTINKHKGSKRSMERFIEGDVQVAICTNREDAFKLVREALSV